MASNTMSTKRVHQDVQQGVFSNVNNGSLVIRPRSKDEQGLQEKMDTGIVLNCIETYSYNSFRNIGSRFLRLFGNALCRIVGVFFGGAVNSSWERAIEVLTKYSSTGYDTGAMDRDQADKYLRGCVAQNNRLLAAEHEKANPTALSSRQISVQFSSSIEF